MEGDSFQQWKSQCLTKNDFSRKGSVDEEISHIVAFINSQDQYFTTSSCSGRIVLFDGVSDCLEQQKQNCCWLFVTHQPCHKDDVIGGLEKSVGDATLKFEPFILHVQCKQLEDAQLLHTAAINAGFRNSGVTVGKKGKIIMAVRSSHCLEVPLTHKGKVLVTDEYLQYLVGVANQKMGENLRRISRFYDCLRGALQALEDPEEPEHKPIYRRRRKRYQAKSLTDGCHNDRKKEEQEENSEDEVDCGSLFSEET